MSEFRRRLMMVGGGALPYDARVEYIESTGTQYIDTGITYNHANTYEIKCQMMPTEFKQAVALNGWDAGGAFGVLSGYTTNGDGVKFGNSAINNFCTLDLLINAGTSTQSVLFVNVNGNDFNRSRAHTSLGTYASNSGYLLFACYSRNSVSAYIKERIYSCKIYVNSVLVRDMIAVRKSGVGYLYDKIGGELYGNLGSGVFIIGADYKEYDDFGYVNFGKVFQLDGISRGNDANYWTEIINGWQFPYGNGKNLLSDSVEFLSGNDGMGIDGSSISIPIFNPVSYTAEYTFEESRVSDTQVLFMPRIGGSSTTQVAFGRNGNTYYTSAIGIGSYFSSSSTGKHYAVLNNVMYVNGSAISASGNDALSTKTDDFTVGYRNGNQNVWTGRLYSIRVYNRILTHTELMHNLSIDNERFNLGLTI